MLALILSWTNAREFSTNLYQLDKKIRLSAPTLQYVIANQYDDITENFQPLITLPCDTENFQEQTKHKWHKNTSLITDETIGKRPEFNLI